MTALLRFLVRSGGVALLLVGYVQLYELIVPATVDADIGEGLLAFLLLVVVAGVVGLVDGLRHRLVANLVVWAGVALMIAVGWEVVLDWSVGGPGIGFDELADSSGSIGFVFWLIAVPAWAGVALGTLIARLSGARPHSSEQRARVGTR